MTKAIADSVVKKSTESDPSVLIALHEQALELLQDGERTAAAALFNAARTFSPNDPTLRNNYAFCILLDRPDEARMLLEEALAVDVSDRVVSLCNLMLVHHLLGNDEQALKCASDAFDGASARGTGAYLWERDSDGTWAVVHVAPRDWIIRLGASIEAGLGCVGASSKASTASTNRLLKVLHQQK